MNPKSNATKLQRLQQLRAEIDAIDGQLHDLLRARAAVVHRVRAVKGKQSIFIRPGREATMIRALLKRQQGRIPPGLIVRLWREMIGSFTMQEGALRIAVTCGKGEQDLWDLTRDYYGSFTPLLQCPTADKALTDVAQGLSEIAVLPLPGASDPRPWWRRLARFPELRIFARLPYDPHMQALYNGRGCTAGALVVARLAPEPTGADHGMLLARVHDRDAAAPLRAALVRTLKPVAIAGSVDQEYWLLTVPGLMNGRTAEIAVAPRLAGVTLHDCGGYALPDGR